jgi:hypothetical protein
MNRALGRYAGDTLLALTTPSPGAMDRR